MLHVHVHVHEHVHVHVHVHEHVHVHVHVMLAYAYVHGIGHRHPGRARTVHWSAWQSRPHALQVRACAFAYLAHALRAHLVTHLATAVCTWTLRRL
jgi:hypothetical protein